MRRYGREGMQGIKQIDTSSCMKNIIYDFSVNNAAIRPWMFNRHSKVLQWKTYLTDVTVHMEVLVHGDHTDRLSRPLQ